MRLGLLQCDQVPGSVVGVAGDYDAMFRRWLDADWKVYDLRQGELPADLDECDGYATTGSRASVYDDVPWIHGFADLVRRIHDARKPLLGVCFGHQMIAHALGGRVIRNPGGCELGARSFPIAKGEAWMAPPLPRLTVLMSCCDQVVALPPDATVLAGDERCPVALYRVGTLLGVQGHPEWSAEFAAALYRSREEGLGKAEVAAAQATLARPLDHARFADWTRRFLESAGAHPDRA